MVTRRCTSTNYLETGSLQAASRNNDRKTDIIIKIDTSERVVDMINYLTNVNDMTPIMVEFASETKVKATKLVNVRYHRMK